MSTYAPPDAVILVLLSCDWPELVPAEPLRVLAVSSTKRPVQQLCLPGGKVEPGDFARGGPMWGARHAACRELHEETGIVATPSMLRWVWGGVSDGRLSVWAYRVVPDPTVVQDGLRPEAGCRAVWLTPAELWPVCPFEGTNKPAVAAAVQHRAVWADACDVPRELATLKKDAL